MNHPEQSTQHWAALYTAAEEFKRLAPWAWMCDRDVFGVQNPSSGEVAYCSVLGRLGQVFALNAFLGSEGLETLQRMAAGGLDAGTEDLAVLQRCLMASFEDRDGQEAPDLKVVKALGLKFRGANGWPLFRNYRPGHFPWFLDGAEVTFLALVLQQAVGVCGRFREDPELLDPLEEDHYLVRVRQADGSWADCWMRPAPLAEKDAPAPVVDEVLLVRLKDMVTRRCAAWEADLFYAPMPVSEKRGERPYFPPAALLVDRESCHVLGTELFGPTEDLAMSAPHLVESLLKAVAQTKALPEVIVVCREELARALGPVAERLGCKLELARRLPALDAFKRELFARMG